MGDKYVIEIATTDFAGTQAAVEGGADRIELCTSLSEGGLTPSYGTILQCRESFEVPIYVMIRPRSGDFLYSDEEFDIMRKDVKMARETGCDGVVFGILNKDGSIDRDRCIRLVENAYPLKVTFHRAFDRCLDPFVALEQLIEAGCERILTSGQMPSAPEATEMIAHLRESAGERITIMPGSGVRKDNIRQIAQLTGCREFHASLRATRKSAMEFIHPAFKQSGESYTHPGVLAEEVRALKDALEGE